MTVPLHAHKVTARNDGRHIVPLTIVEQKFKFRIELHPCAFESGGDELGPVKIYAQNCLQAPAE